MNNKHNPKSNLGDMQMKYKIGIDIGGTFTDFLLAYEDGTVGGIHG